LPSLANRFSTRNSVIRPSATTSPINVYSSSLNRYPSVICPFQIMRPFPALTVPVEESTAKIACAITKHYIICWILISDTLVSNKPGVHFAHQDHQSGGQQTIEDLLAFCSVPVGMNQRSPCHPLVHYSEKIPYLA
jgi:hypothetical protein